MMSYKGKSLNRGQHSHPIIPFPPCKLFINMKCAIIDDEPLALDLLESYVRKTNVLELCGRYSNAVEAIGGLQRNPVDLVFLDIQMPDLNGIDFSRHINTDTTCIVFTTAFSQYALDGYKVSALDYLLKPISYVDFVGAVSKAQRWYEKTCLARQSELLQTERPAQPTEASLASQTTASSQGGYMFVKSDYKLLRINFDDIVYIEGLKDYVKIYTEGNTKATLSLSSMHSIESALPSSQFFRVHRSYIVNVNKVKVLERGQIIFGEKYIPVSDSYREKFTAYLNAHTLQGR